MQRISIDPRSLRIRSKAVVSARRLTSITLIASLMLALTAASHSPVVAMDTASLQTASAVPAVAQFYLAVDVDTTGPQITKSLELLERAGLSDSDDSLSTIVSPGAEARGVNVETVDELIDGELAVAGTGLNVDALGVLSDLPMDGDLSGVNVDEIGSNVSSGIAVVITASNMDEVTVELIAEFREDAATAGSPVEETEVEGAQVLVTEGDAATGEAGNVMAILDDVVILGEVLEDVRPFIEAQAGVVPSLANEPDFIETMAQLPDESLLAVYTPGPSDLNSIEALLREAGVSLALDLLVGPGAASGFALSADDAGFRVDTVRLAKTGEQFEVAGLASNLTLADRVPSDSLLLVNGFDLGTSLAFRLIEQLLVVGSGLMSGSTEIVPEMTQAYIDSQYAEFVQLLGFNLQTAFIQQLQGEYGFAVTGVDPVDPANIQAILTSEVGDPLVVTDALSSAGALVQAFSEGQAVVSTVTIGESSLNQVALNADGSEITVQYGLVGDEFALSVGEALVEYTLGIAEPLSANPDFQEALSLLPAEYDGLFYLATSDLAETGEPILTEASSDLDSGLEDANDRCAEYITQPLAQAAYDEDPINNFELDLNFNGVACDDYFDDTAPGSPVAVLDAQANIGSFAVVSYKQDGMAFTSGILVIPDEE